MFWFTDLSRDAHTAALAVRELHLPPAERMLADDLTDAELVETAAELVARIEDTGERTRILDYWARLSAEVNDMQR